MIDTYNQLLTESTNELSTEQKRQLKCLAYARSFINEDI
jgi:hypothetical protein